MAPRGHIFLSYARRERAFADRLAEDLLSRGIPVWRDVENIEPGPVTTIVAVARRIAE